MAREVGFGIIGGGLMGREFASVVARWGHLMDFPLRPVIVSVASRTSRSLEHFAGLSPRPIQLATDYVELLRNPAVQAVYVAVPHDLHHRVYTDCLRAGKHLLGEKPFGIDMAANTAILSEAARHPDSVVRCCSEFPYWPGAQQIYDMIRKGEMGRILEVECGLQHSSDLDPAKPINWKRRIATNGEYGCMGDLGPHVLHIPIRAGWRFCNLRALLTKVITRRPATAGSNEMVPCDTWDNATLLCQMAGTSGESFPLTARMTRIDPGEANTWSLCVKGTTMSARFTSRYPQTLQTLAYTPGHPQAWQERQLGYQSIYKTVTGGIFEFGFADTMLQMVAAFCDQLGKGPKAELPFGCATPAETATMHRILTAALRSQASSQVVQVDG